MRNRLIGAAAAMLAVTAFGCGGKSNSSAAWTCNVAASTGFCYEWTAPSNLNSSDVSQLQQALQQNCTSSQGIFSTGLDCPAMNRVGTCAQSYDQEHGVPHNIVLYAPNHSAQVGQALCVGIGGAWTPS